MNFSSCVSTPIALAAMLLAGRTPLPAQSGSHLTARQVIDRIRAHTGVPWREKTVDTFKAGDPETPVTGIAVTMMATYDVLQRAAAQHQNLIITHEPTFYSHLDQTGDLKKEHDPVWAEKERFIREHHLVVWRFHDHWHMRRPDGILTGVVQALQWGNFQSTADPQLFVMPEITLAALAEQMKQRLGIHVVRVVGNPDMKVTRVGLSPGAGGPLHHRELYDRDKLDVLAIGEVPEWETIEYSADAASEGKNRALILLGHIPSEQPGMKYCAEWLRTFVTEVPVEFVPAREMFWLAQ
ncbi:MAG TPA: Nif3-like dinuclear metal center hexameric protein [Bryobacteraceae bacterium]|nr:Nif3-like dinuclear metal center hexameric protein [Bryobacteraceae bacterium]